MCGPPDISETTTAGKLNLKMPIDMVKYPLWIQKLLYYTTQHEGGRHIDFRQMSKMSAEADYGQQLQDGFQPTCRREL